jgi:hypothetical protein
MLRSDEKRLIGSGAKRAATINRERQETAFAALRRASMRFWL